MKASEHVPIRFRTIVWISYLSAVSGCIAALALKSLFRLSVSSISAITSRVSILTVTPVSSYSGAGFFSQAELFALVFCFGLGSFVSGLILTARSSDGSLSLITMHFPLGPNSCGSYLPSRQHVRVCKFEEADLFIVLLHTPDLVSKNTAAKVFSA
jgi:hypothetical protein